MNLMQNVKMGQELTVFRRELRNRLITARESMPAALRATAEAAIERYLEGLLARLAPQVFGFCWPYRGEFDARPLVMRLLAQGRRACLPVVVAKAAPMLFREWSGTCPMLIDRYGIPVPADGAETIPELLLMPVNGFDAAGYRLGYGGGYFDRTLESLKPRPLAVGLGFESARVETIHPQPYDLPLDYLVTETGAYRVGPAGLTRLDI